MQARLIVSFLGVLPLIATSLASMASQSDHFVGVHEVPQFVCNRVELVAGLASDRSAGSVGRGGHERVAPGEAMIPVAHNAVCARTADGVRARCAGYARPQLPSLSGE